MYLLVVFRFIVNDVSAQVENRQVEQIFHHQKKNIDDASGSSVTIIERMDALELMVNGCNGRDGILYMALYVYMNKNNMCKKGVFLHMFSNSNDIIEWNVVSEESEKFLNVIIYNPNQSLYLGLWVDAPTSKVIFAGIYKTFIWLWF